MRTRGRLVVIGLLLAGALGFTAMQWWSGDDATTPSAASLTTAAAPTPGIAATTHGQPLVAPAASAERDATSLREPASPNAASAAIRGRCVDENGAPLAGCSVRLTATPTGNARTAAWQNPEPRITAVDGAFAFEFLPPADHQFWLTASAEARISTRAYWPDIAANQQIDVGGLALRPGIVVRGRVVDEQGAAVANIGLVVCVGPRNQGPGPCNSGFASSAADGTFQLEAALPPGPFSVEVHGDRAPKTPITGTLAMERPIETVQVMLPTFDPREWIQGRVVDDIGQAIGNAMIEVGSENGSRVVVGSSRRDGTFRIQRHATVPDQPVRLVAQHPDFEDGPTTQPIAWGSTDTVLMLPRASMLTVHVRDVNGDDVTNFTVWAIPDETRAPPSRSGNAVARGPFADGFATLQLRRGPRRVVVEFPPALQRPLATTAIDVLATDMRVEVRAEPMVQRVMRVVDGAGQPIAGTQVQLCDLLDGEFSEATHVMAMAVYLLNRGTRRAAVLQDGVTNTEGSIVLRGPGSRRLGLRVLGPGHVPLHGLGVDLTEAGELRVVVSVGARLRGRIGPQDAIDFLRGLAGDEAAQQRSPLRLRLENKQPSRASAGLPGLRQQVQEPSCTLANNGGFDQAGLPPGAYVVSIQYANAPFGEVLGEVTLVDGQTTQFDAPVPVDLMTPGTLRGRILQNGEAAANARLQLHGTTRDALGRETYAGAFATTDATGSYTVNVRPGAYTARIQLKENGLASGSLSALQTAVVRTRQVTEHDFSIATGTLSVTVRDATGAPIGGVSIFNDTTVEAERIYLQPTDASGKTTCQLPAQTIALRTLPKRLLSSEARNKLFMGGGWQAFEPHWIPLGTATIRAGATTTLELRLPADWDK